MLDGIALGFQHLMNPMVLLALFGGVLLGLIVGSLPGLNDSITIAVLIPVTFGMDAYVAFALLCGIYVSSACGGSFPAILMNIPGTASAMRSRSALCSNAMTGKVLRSMPCRIMFYTTRRSLSWSKEV